MDSGVTRSLSVADRTNDDSIAMENFIATKHREIRDMVQNGDITSGQGDAIYHAINHYVQFNGGKSRGGFQRGLEALIQTHLRDLADLMRRLDINQ